MKFRTLLVVILAAILGLSACSSEARYRRYVKSSIRAKEKRQKKIRKDIDRQNREITRQLEEAELPPPRVSVQ